VILKKQKNINENCKAEKEIKFKRHIFKTKKIKTKLIIKKQSIKKLKKILFIN